MTDPRTALAEAHRNQAEDDYFAPRPVQDGAMSRKSFCDGFDRGWSAAREALAAQPDDNPWRAAIDEALVCAHLGVATEPYADLNKLLDWHHDIWLDPAVCQEAQDLIDRGAADERARLSKS
jgi:hypothetical protein